MPEDPPVSPAPLTATRAADQLSAAHATHLAHAVSAGPKHAQQSPAARRLYDAAANFADGEREPACADLRDAAAMLSQAANDCRLAAGDGLAPPENAEILEGFALRAQRLQGSPAYASTGRVMAEHRQFAADIAADLGLTGLSTRYEDAGDAQAALLQAVRHIDTGNPLDAAAQTSQAARLMTGLSAATSRLVLATDRREQIEWLRGRCRDLSDHVLEAYRPEDADGNGLKPGDRTELTAPSPGGLYPAGTRGRVSAIYGDVVALSCGTSPASITVARADQVRRKPPARTAPGHAASPPEPRPQLL